MDTILGTLDHLDRTKLASFNNPSINLYLNVYNLETSQYKFAIFTLIASKLFIV